jgi:hypothetical protein
MACALSFPNQVRRLRLKVAAQPNHLDEVCRAFRSSATQETTQTIKARKARIGTQCHAAPAEAWHHRTAQKT